MSARADLLAGRAGEEPVPDRRGSVAVDTVLRVLGAVAAVAAIALGLVLAGAAGGVRDGIQLIGYRTAPPVAATEDLYFALADMDAQLTNILLAGDDPTLAKIRTDGLTACDRDRARAEANLLQAAAVAGPDDTAHGTVRDVLGGMGSYEALAAQMIQLNDAERNPAGRPSPRVLDLHRQATDLMGTTLRTASTLTDLSSDVLEQSYRAKRETTVTARRWLGGLGGLLLGALVGLQIALRVRLHRRVNPALLVATVLAGWLAVGGIAVMAAESEYLRVARKDAFTSILALRQVRAVSYDANADESRYLVDPDRAGRYQQAFLEKSETLAGTGVGDVRQYDAALAQALDAYRADHADVRVTGFFGTELNNITFAGERNAAEQTMDLYQVYQRDDRTIRDLAERGDLRAAIAFCTSTEPGNSDHDFYA